MIAIKCVTLLLPILIILGMGMLELHRPPEWSNDTLTNWRKINFISIGSAIAITLISSLLWWRTSLYNFITVEIIISALAFIFCSSVFCDFQVRRVDRRILWSGILLGIILNGLHLYLIPSPLSFLYVILLFVALGFLFIPIMGQSDARALILIVACVFPILGIDLLTDGLLFFVAEIIIYALIKALGKRKETDGSFRSFMELLGKKVSIPVVPLLIFPQLFLLLISPIIV